MSENGGHDFPHFGYVVKSLQAKPEGLGTRYAVTLSAQKTAKDGDHQYSLS